MRGENIVILSGNRSGGAQSQWKHKARS